MVHILVYFLADRLQW